MKNLDEITARDYLAIPEFRLDRFQGGIMENLYLEFFLQKGRCLITPQYKFLTTEHPTAQEESMINDILDNRTEHIKHLKAYLLFNLSLYSALIETNSYYISSNNSLLIARFIKQTGDIFEVKLYTHDKDDLLLHYKDKIYLGRDFVSLSTVSRDHFGIRFVRNSLQDQLEKLRSRLSRFVPAENNEELNAEYMEEISELLDEFSGLTNDILSATPMHLSSSASIEEMTDANARYRELKHLLMEIEDSVREMEARMFALDLGAVRYVTKFRKDLVNAIHLMIKVNSRITDFVNGIHI
ncbi:MAG: hypothetical protein HS115_19695 [Spirochaetales bacterium]|nr:hypothetical protein [Spirochaetales bacterium]